jgi:hypothetical protein
MVDVPLDANDDEPRGTTLVPSSIRLPDSSGERGHLRAQVCIRQLHDVAFILKGVVAKLDSDAHVEGGGVSGMLITDPIPRILVGSSPPTSNTEEIWLASFLIISLNTFSLFTCLLS